MRNLLYGLALIGEGLAFILFYSYGQVGAAFAVGAISLIAFFLSMAETRRKVMSQREIQTLHDGFGKGDNEISAAEDLIKGRQ